MLNDHKYDLEAQMILSQARNLIAQPYAWTKGAYSKPHIRAPHGAAYCSVGALEHIAGPMYLGPALRAKEVLSAAMGGSVVEFNDSHTKAEVLAAFDRAIAKLQSDYCIGDIETA